MRISNSFSEGEIQVLDFIVQTLLRGGTPTMATRHKEFASLCRKVMAMKNKVNEKHEKERLAQKQPPAPEMNDEPEDKEPVSSDSETNLEQVAQIG